MTTIGACIIAKNESVLLPRCLDSLRGIDAIYISDTGSTDNTVEIAKKYTPNVWTEDIWHDSFCDARNFILKKATTDWILSIDVDEFLHDFSKVREAIELAEKRNALAINIKMIAEDHTQQTFYFPRLFKRDPRVWWEGAIHNHISVVGEDLGNVEVTYGYSPAHHQDKDRAFRILKKEVDRTGNGREMFYLAREYWYKQDYENALILFGKYVQKSRFLPEKAEAFLTMAMIYWEIKDGNSARDACAQALIVNPNFKEAVLFMAKLAGDGSGNEKWQKNADQWKRMATTADNSDVLFVRNI